MAFRGTEANSANDLKADLNLLKNETLDPDGGHVHSGFQSELDELLGEIKKELDHNENLKIRKDVYITGHSLGGAMATIAAARQSARVRELFTFGSPRVGGREFTDYCFVRHHRFVNNNDIVTRIPPRFLMYRHDGEERYFNCYGQLRNPTGWQRSKDMARGVWYNLKDLKVFDSFMDHGIDNYVLLVKRNKRGLNEIV